MKQIECINSRGDSIIFANEEPFFLSEYSGIHTKSGRIVGTRSAFGSGQYYHGTDIGERNIVLTGQIFGNYEKTTQWFSQIFAQNDLGTLIYTDQSSRWKIHYHLESYEIGCSGKIRNFSVSLICSDPYFQEENPGTASFQLVETTVVDQFKKVLINNPTTLQAGFEMEIDIQSIPSRFQLETDRGEFLLVSGFSSEPGDKIIFTVRPNVRKIDLIHNGQSTSLLNKLRAGSNFFLLPPGKTVLTLSGAASTQSEAVIIPEFRWEAV